MRNLGTRGYCLAHLVEFYRQWIPPEAWIEHGGGIGLPDLFRPDLGSGYAELTCSCCSAGWTGVVLERCPWCAELLNDMSDWQAAKVLTPPDVVPGASNYSDRMTAWAERLARGVEAEIVTERQAQQAWRAAVRDVAA